ncbi:unnamed protein product [Vitrella brassicaformis CCMP3155]|uniref:CDP-diacylglycerol--glycerol-3-phosphate 3-phosphatidyltransferase n=1 Tax=Vitrella brassicaformis (strain CCMP3155) TaxID=1169540 RepID=A0A0G4EB97_VITBC|nr:unnamed protein product [Vitrella brassicaformis CCMP3155]|eukprot:CEL92539.1 unnamed protein product [Vitrella brassicaformis CCMP3155]
MLVPSVSLLLMSPCAAAHFVRTAWTAVPRRPLDAPPMLTRTRMPQRRRTHLHLLPDDPDAATSRIPDVAENAAAPGVRRDVSLPSCIRAMLVRLPNTLTVLRVLVVPVVGILLLSNMAANKIRLWTCVCFGFACLTDWFDGWLARALGVSSAFGAFLDPVADKLLVATVLIGLVSRVGCALPYHGASLAIPSIAIVCREIGVSALREWMALRGQAESVQVNWTGKLKTAAQMVAGLLLLASWRDGTTEGVVGSMMQGGSLAVCLTWRVGVGCLWVAALLSLLSACTYFQNITETMR